MKDLCKRVVVNLMYWQQLQSICQYRKRYKVKPRYSEHYFKWGIIFTVPSFLIKKILTENQELESTACEFSFYGKRLLVSWSFLIMDVMSSDSTFEIKSCLFQRSQSLELPSGNSQIEF